MGPEGGAASPPGCPTTFNESSPPTECPPLCAGDSWLSRTDPEPMNSRVISLLHVFVGKLGGEVQVAVRRGSGASARWETSTTIEETVTRFAPEDGVVELELVNGQPARLHFEGPELLSLLEEAGEDGSAAWGEGLSDEEAAARFLTVHLQESLATREPHPSGWWSYEPGGFTPEPPWDAAARRRR